MNYYCLIAGLPDIQAEDTKTNVSLANLKTELNEQLAPADKQLLALIFARYDNTNLLAYLNKRDAELNSLGNLTADDWTELTALIQETETPADSRLQPYLHQFFKAINSDKFSQENSSREDYLAALYYGQALQSKNKFIHDWFEFNLNINNILTGVACRKHGFDVKSLVVGSNEVAVAVRQSNARDFGLTGTFAELDTILKIAEEQNLLEREKKIDALKWQWLEDKTFFHYFSVERILAFVLKVQMIERWKLLSVENGSRIFRALLAGMKEGVKFTAI